MRQLCWKLQAWTKSNNWWRHDCLLRADLDIYLPNHSKEELRYGCAVIQHICINLRCILVDRSTLSLVLDMMYWWSYVRIYQKKKSSCLLWQPVYMCSVIEGPYWLVKPYCSGTIWVNKYLPEDICKPGRMICWAHKSYQAGSSNLVATVWQDNRIVRLVSTNSNPRNVVHTDRRLDHNVIQVHQPQNIQLYNRYMNGVDCLDQMHMKYDVGHFSVKAWKYILWYFMNTSIVNAYILYCKTSTRQSKKEVCSSWLSTWDWNGIDCWIFI